MSRAVAHQLEQSYMIKKIGNRGRRVYVIQLGTNLTGADCYVRGNYGTVVKAFERMPKDMQALARWCVMEGK